jgi:hypothetical protein
MGRRLIAAPLGRAMRSEAERHSTPYCAKTPLSENHSEIERLIVL